MNSDDDDGDAAADLIRLAVRVAHDGLVRLTVGGTHLVCVTEEAFDRLTGRASALPDPRTASRPVHLSPREEQILRLVGNGLTAAEAAAVLGLAVNTVSQHLVSARRKYGVTSTRAAVEAARRDGQL